MNHVCRLYVQILTANLIRCLIVLDLPLTMEEGKVVRKVIDADNNCLFNAVGYVMEHDKSKAHELRQVIASSVLSNPEAFNEAVLEKSPADYCEWILNPQKWGGAIELAILSDFYKREIAAYDIQTKRCDVYGQGKRYDERVFLIYDGLHYDALALTPFDGAPEEVELTIFSLRENSTLRYVQNQAIKLVEEAQRARKFTDMSKFTLRCGVCQQGVVGQKEAVEHAKATRHTNFQEFS